MEIYFNSCTSLIKFNTRINIGIILTLLFSYFGSGNFISHNIQVDTEYSIEKVYDETQTLESITEDYSIFPTESMTENEGGWPWWAAVIVLISLVSFIAIFTFGAVKLFPGLLIRRKKRHGLAAVIRNIDFHPPDLPASTEGPALTEYNRRSSLDEGFRVQMRHNPMRQNRNFESRRGVILNELPLELITYNENTNEEPPSYDIVMLEPVNSDPKMFALNGTTSFDSDNYVESPPSYFTVKGEVSTNNTAGS